MTPHLVPWLRLGVGRVPAVLLTLLSAWGVVRSARGAGEEVLYITSILWVLYGILSATVFTVTRLPDTAARFFMGVGVASPTQGLSAIETLAAKGQYAKAAEAYLSRQGDPESGCEAMLRRSALLAGPLAQPTVAARELTRFRDHRHGLSAADDLWIGRTLIDLYDGPLSDPGQAMGELRRLLDRYPESAQASTLHRMLDALRHERFGQSPPSTTTESS